MNVPRLSSPWIICGTACRASFILKAFGTYTRPTRLALSERV